MIPCEPVAGEPREKSLFERWIDITPEEWDALEDSEDAADEQLPLL